MSKGIATETIIKLMLGLIVVVIILYLVYKFVLRSPLDVEQCKAKFTSWCTGCKISNFGANPFKMSSDLGTCVLKHSIALSHNSCTEAGVQDECKPYLPIVQ